MPPTLQTTGIYAKGKMRWMTWFHGIKGFLLAPLLAVLTRIGVTANALSIFSGLTALGGFAAFLTTGKPLAFLAGVWASLLIDGCDGALARYQKKQSAFGSFLDVAFDHIGIVSSCLYALLIGAASAPLLLLYAVLYTCVVCFAFVLGTIGHPYAFVLRPRVIIFATLTIDAVWNTHVTEPTLILTTLLLFFSTIEGLVKLGTSLRQYLSA